MLLAPSCDREISHELNERSNNERIYNEVKNEMKVGLTLSSLKSYSQTDFENTVQENETAYMPPIVEYTKKIDSIEVTETTKSFLYNLPIILLENTYQKNNSQ